MSRISIPSADQTLDAAKPLLAAVRLAGFEEASVLEIVINVARTDIDFPKVSAKLAA